MNAPKPGSFFWLGPLMSCCAKNARITTIRIGNAALLENLLILRNPGRTRSSEPSKKGAWSRPMVGARQLPRRRCSVGLREGGDVRQVAMTLVVVEAVADDEAGGDLEAHGERLRG